MQTERKGGPNRCEERLKLSFFFVVVDCLLLIAISMDGRMALSSLHPSRPLSLCFSRWSMKRERIEPSFGDELGSDHPLNRVGHPILF